jgi:hypothetical protein
MCRFKAVHKAKVAAGVDDTSSSEKHSEAAVTQAAPAPALAPVADAKEDTSV